MTNRRERAMLGRWIVVAVVALAPATPVWAACDEVELRAAAQAWADLTAPPVVSHLVQGVPPDPARSLAARVRETPEGRQAMADAEARLRKAAWACPMADAPR